jgi:hypothetical protein
MRYAVLQLLLLSTLGFADHAPASCQISDKSVLSNSASGIAQVSNLELIQISCHVAARGPLMKPGEVRYGLKAEAAVYKISADGTRNSVPSDVNVSGGGSRGTTDWVDFYIHIPLDPADRDAEIRRYLAILERGVADNQLLQKRIRQWQKNPQALAAIISQNRLGRFEVDCRVLDGDLVIGVGRVGLEVLFKGHFSDPLAEKK